MAGTIHAAPYLTLHRRIGQAANDETTLEVLVIEPTGEPMIRHPDGRTWVLTWDEIIAMAVEKFAEPVESAPAAPQCLD